MVKENGCKRRKTYVSIQQKIISIQCKKTNKQISKKYFFVAQSLQNKITQKTDHSGHDLFTSFFEEHYKNKKST